LNPHVNLLNILIQVSINIFKKGKIKQII